MKYLQKFNEIIVKHKSKIMAFALIILLFGLIALSVKGYNKFVKPYLFTFSPNIIKNVQSDINQKTITNEDVEILSNNLKNDAIIRLQKYKSFDFTVLSDKSNSLSFGNIDKFHQEYMDEFKIPITVNTNTKSKFDFTLCLRYIENAGILYFFESPITKKDFPEIKFLVSVKDLGNTNFTYRTTTIKNGADFINSPVYVTKKQPLKLDNLSSCINFEGSNKSIFLFNKAYIKDLGTKVIRRELSDNGCGVYDAPNTKYFSYDIDSLESYKTYIQGFVSDQEMVNWKDELSVRTFRVMSLGNNFQIFLDGIYSKNYTTYEPYEKNTYFRYPSALMIRSCSELYDKFSLFKAFSTSLTYSFVGEYNEQGFIPTKSKSQWLYKEYKIQGDFYDTRWNTDTFSALMRISKFIKDKKVTDAIDRYYKFFENHAKTNNFTTQDGLFFISDYIAAKESSVKAHCSLNHYITEMDALYEYYELSQNSEALDLARKILKNIDASASKWIKSNGDLYYGIYTNGEYKGDDYPLVTYNDLVHTLGILKKYNEPVPDGLTKLYESKKKYAKSKGYIK